ncbi:MAG: 16S rRNA (cytosine(1402)-N(4))-methyltransferase RsmH [Desulfobacterales bacterium]
MGYRHVPCMLKEVMASLACRPGMIVVDGTLGGSGHAKAIAAAIQPGGILVGIDRDPEAIRNAEIELAPWSASILLFNDSFAHLPAVLEAAAIPKVDGILLDLGISRDQLESGGRGFSFQKDDPLDMRMDPGSGETAAGIVNTFPERDLELVFREYGEERFARRIARAIVRERQHTRITRSLHLAGIIAGAVPAGHRRRQSLHPATRVFMALRIAVNRELVHLDRFLDSAVECLKPGGRLCILSFHSLEDRRVKHRFRELAAGCICPKSVPVCQCGKVPSVRLLTRRVARPTEAEVSANPLCRSTRLRAVEKR